MNASNQKLLQAVLLPDSEGLAAFQQWRTSANLDALPAEQYPLLPLLHGRLTTWQVEDPWLGRIKGIYRRTWYANQLALNTLAELLAALAAAGIPAVIGGGAALALTCYPEPAARPIYNPEVFVSENNRQRAKACLAELPQKNTQEAKTSMPVVCLQPFSKTDGRFWTQTRPLTVNNKPGQIPGPAASLLLACQGLYRSDLLARVDAALIIRTGQVDWDSFSQMAIAFRQELPVLEVLPELPETTGTAIPLACLVALRSQQPDPMARLMHRLRLTPSARRSLPVRVLLKVTRWR